MASKVMYTANRRIGGPVYERRNGTLLLVIEHQQVMDNGCPTGECWYSAPSPDDLINLRSTGGEETWSRGGMTVRSILLWEQEDYLWTKGWA